jgi:acyl-CoA thioester hydrolase
MYLKKFEIRWNDLDANRHLANSAYIQYMSHTRMSYLSENGFDHKAMAKHRIGPVVFHEHVYYFKESLGGQILVTFELGGISEDGRFFRFVHNFYNEDGINLAYCEMQGAWIDLNTRSTTPLPAELMRFVDTAPKTEDFKLLTKEDMRSGGRKPEDIIF